MLAETTEDDEDTPVFRQVTALDYLGSKLGLARIDADRQLDREIKAKINDMVESKLSSIAITSTQIDEEIRRYWLELQENYNMRPRTQIRKHDRDLAYKRLFLIRKKIGKKIKRNLSLGSLTRSQRKIPKSK